MSWVLRRRRLAQRPRLTREAPMELIVLASAPTRRCCASWPKTSRPCARRALRSLTSSQRRSAQPTRPSRTRAWASIARRWPGGQASHWRTPPHWRTPTHGNRCCGSRVTLIAAKASLPRRFVSRAPRSRTARARLSATPQLTRARRVPTSADSLAPSPRRSAAAPRRLPQRWRGKPPPGQGRCLHACSFCSVEFPTKRAAALHAESAHGWRHPAWAYRPRPDAARPFPTPG